jgi:sporulation protein YtfJ
MERNTLGEVMGISMTKMKEMVNVNTIIGDPIYTPDGITLIPVTQVSMGMGAGGADSMGKNVMGAGAGGGVKMNPQGFLIIKDGMIRFVSTKAPADTSLDRLLDMIPDMFDRVEKLVKDVKAKKNPTE